MKLTTTNNVSNDDDDNNNRRIGPLATSGLVFSLLISF